MIVALSMLVEGRGVPLPSETMLVTADAFAAQGRLLVCGVMLAATPPTHSFSVAVGVPLSWVAFVAFLRMIVPMLAGVAHMSFGRLSAYNAAGSCGATLAHGLLGYRFGRNLPALEHHLTRASLVLNPVVFIGYLVIEWRSKRLAALST